MSDDNHAKDLKKGFEKKEEPPPEHVIKHRIWREKQIQIFYKSGRPIYNCFRQANHLYYKTTTGTYIGSYN